MLENAARGSVLSLVATHKRRFDAVAILKRDRLGVSLEHLLTLPIRAGRLREPLTRCAPTVPNGRELGRAAARVEREAKRLGLRPAGIALERTYCGAENATVVDAILAVSRSGAGSCLLSGSLHKA